MKRAEIPGHPDAQAASYTQTEGSTGKQWNAVRAFTPHGQYVFMQLAQSVDGPDPAVGLVAKTIDLQGPAIDQFRATDPSEFTDISLDPTGLLARTLPVPEKDATTVQNTTYEQRGALQFQYDPSRSATLFTDTGTDLVAMAKTKAFLSDQGPRERGENRGRLLRRVAGDRLRNRPSRSTICRTAAAFWLKDKSFYCLGAADRYAIETSSDNLLDAQQQVAAQYAMLLSG